MTDDIGSVHRRKLDFQRSPTPEPPTDEDGALRVWLDEAGVLQTIDDQGATAPLGGAANGYAPGGTDVAIADGGTGSSTAAAARTALGVPAIADVTAVAAAVDALEAATELVAVQYVIDGGGAAITAGLKGFLEVPFAWSDIVAGRLLADQAGSASVHIWKDTYANFPPVVGDKISASAPLALSAAAKSEDTVLTGWTKNGAAGDILAFNVEAGPATIQRLLVSLTLRKLVVPA